MKKKEWATLYISLMIAALAIWGIIGAAELLSMTTSPKIMGFYSMMVLVLIRELHWAISPWVKLLIEKFAKERKAVE